MDSSGVKLDFSVQVQDSQPAVPAGDQSKLSSQADMVKDASDHNDGDNEKKYVPPAALPPKKKKKSRGKAKKPSGFEENFADAPVTPAEYEEEQDLYDIDLPFASRIETCIQRYKARRKFDSERKDIFDKYMRLGGVISEQNMFTGGLSQTDVEEKTAGEIASMTATNHVGEDKDDAGEEGSPWVVDFAAIVKAFLSTRIQDFLPLEDEKQIQFCVSTIRNFLNYVLHHDVCPEYTAQIEESRKICNMADIELVRIMKLNDLLPGKYNTACSTLYGGQYAGLYTHDSRGPDGLDSTMGMSDEEAKQVVMAGIAAYKTKKELPPILRGDFRVVDEAWVGLEVTGIKFAGKDVKAFYEQQLDGSIPVLGMMRAKSWTNPRWSEEDYSDDGEFELSQVERTYEFWIEDVILKECFVGMKFEASVKELSCGLFYFDTVTRVYCSFYTYVENELWQSWKDLRMLEKGSEEATEQLVGEPDEEGEEET